MGIGFFCFPMSIEPPYFTGLTFIRCLVMPRLFNPHLIIQPLILVNPDLVLPLNHPLLTISTSRTPLGLSKRSKCPSELMLLLRTLLFGTFSKSAMICFVDAYYPGSIFPGLEGMLRDLAGVEYPLWPTSPSSSTTSFLIILCYSPSIFLLCAHVEGNVWVEHGGVSHYIWCLVLDLVWSTCALYMLLLIVFGVFILGFSFV